MKRMMIELTYERVPKEHVYNGLLSITELESQTGSLQLSFEKKDLQDVAEWLHHVVRFVSGLGREFAVRMIRKATAGRSVPIDLTHDQVNKFYESPASARAYFAPMFRHRKEEDADKNQ